ncbi:heparinase II/III family protein [Phyllobacterium sp. YR531]|uniref:heparinase II/III domain-containing protein n=1 Tax=Phyllobacterium sp. YR531 TaxID=1144343 RepID=UPI00026F52FA|nr:heparinase II/III family protein [Phyllobacterium sp. YR531]EJM98729.1 Heparinase II/III-like protein [Phyllobacterium sp. YR531]
MFQWLDGIRSARKKPRILDYEQLDAAFEPMALKTVSLPFASPDIIANADSALEKIFRLPQGGLVDFSKGLDWSINFESANNSWQLWLHSLPFIQDLVVAYANTTHGPYLAQAIFLLSDYLDWLNNPVASVVAWKDEHAITNRSCVLVHLLKKHDEGAIALPAALVSAISQSLNQNAEWLFDDSHYVQNNHGTMADKALLQIALSPGFLTTERSRIWILRALARISMMARLTFDSDGACTENSSAYHLLNVYLFASILDFMRSHSLYADPALEQIVAKAESVSPYFVRTDGSLAMIGDSGIRPTHWVDNQLLASKTGTKTFPGAGFFISKGADLYVTAKCGGSTFSHRHFDDTSITVSYKNRDLIVDPGHYNYDSRDPIFRSIRSFRSHSGIFTNDCDRNAWPNPADPHATGSMTAIEGQNGVLMRSNLADNASIRRIVCVHGEAISIEDQVIADTTVRWRQQFVVHPRCKMTIDGKVVLIEHDGVQCRIESVADSAYIVELGETKYSEKFMQVEPTQMVYFTGVSSHVKIFTRITVSES